MVTHPLPVLPFPDDSSSFFSSSVTFFVFFEPSVSSADVACLQVQDLAGNGPNPLLHVLTWVLGMVFDGSGWWMESRCVGGLVNVMQLHVRA